MVTVSSIDELMDYSLSVFNGWEEIQEVKFTNDMVFCVKIDGEYWDGQFDQRSAKLLVSIYQSLSSIYSDFVNANPGTGLPKRLDKNIRVIANVENGCLNFIADLKEILEIIQKMSTTQMVIAFIGIATIYIGGEGVSSYKEVVKDKNLQMHTQRMAQINSDAEKARLQIVMEQSNIQLEKTLDYSTDTLKTALQPYQTLHSITNKEDTISFPNSGNTYTKEELKTEFAPPSSGAVSTYYVDSLYTIMEWKHIEDNIATISTQGGKIRKAEIQLNDAEKAIFAQHLDNQHSLDLQVTVDISDRKVISSSIIGIGAPRQGSERLQDLID